MFELVVILLSLVVIHYKYRDKMNDLLQSLQGVYKKYEDIAKPHIEYHQNAAKSGKMTNGVERYRKTSNGPQWSGNRHARERKRSAPAESKSSFLGHFKMAPAPCLDFKGTRHVMGSCCPNCVPMSRNSSLVGEVSQAYGLKNILKVDNWKRCDGFVSRRFPVFLHALRTKIPFKYPDVSQSVLTHTRVEQAVEAATVRDLEELGGEETTYGMILRLHGGRAVEALKIMSAGVSHLWLRVAAWSLFKILGRILTSIQVNQSQMDMLKKAHKASIPVIYLPLHRSHLDYILVSFILVNYEIKAPLVAAGDNLRIWFFGSLLRGLGAFFIKRKLDPRAGEKDFVYRAVLHSYMEQVLKSENSLEFFIEGGRSRNGKPCLPKAGLLSVVVEAIFDGIIDDAFIVPVGISYEKILDGNFISEQMGKPKRMESFANAVRSIWKVLHSNFGNVRVDFAQPYSLKEIIQAVQVRPPNKTVLPFAGSAPVSSVGLSRRASISSLDGPDIIVEDEHRFLVKCLANHIVHDAVNVTAIMSTNMLAFLMLNKFRKGVTLNSLVVAFEELKEEITTVRRRDVGFSGETVNIIEHAAKLLGPDLVRMESLEVKSSMGSGHFEMIFLRPNLDVPSILEISYYSNVCLSVFLADSIVATALRTFIDMRDAAVKMREMVVSREHLLNKSLALCDILQYEFIISPPCSTLECTLTEAIQRLMACDIITLSEGGEMTAGQRQWANRMAWSLGCDDDSSEGEDYYSGVDEKLTLHLTPESSERFDFYCSMMGPFIEGYWQLAACLRRLVRKQMDERAFITAALSDIKEKVKQGTVSFPECVSAEILRNGLKLFEKWRIVNSHQQDSVKVLYLNCEFDSEENLLRVLEVLSEFKV